MGNSQKQTTSSTSTYTPNAYAMNAYKSLFPAAQGLASQPYNEATGYQVAPFSQQQQQAFQNISNLQGGYAPYINAASGMTSSAAAPVTGNIGAYMDPYMSSVVDETMRNLRESQGLQQKELTGNAIAQGALGGGKYATARAELARKQNLATGQTLANLLSGGYQQAMQAAQMDAARRLQAGQQMAGLGSESQRLGLEGSQALYGAGSAQQQQLQNLYDTATKNTQQSTMWPYQQLQMLTNLYGSVGPLMGGTTSGTGTTKTKQSGFGSIMGPIIGGLSLFADGGKVSFDEITPPKIDSERDGLFTIPTTFTVKASSPIVPQLPNMGGQSSGSGSQMSMKEWAALGKKARGGLDKILSFFADGGEVEAPILQGVPVGAPVEDIAYYEPGLAAMRNVSAPAPLNFDINEPEPDQVTSLGKGSNLRYADGGAIGFERVTGPLGDTAYRMANGQYIRESDLQEALANPVVRDRLIEAMPEQEDAIRNQWAKAAASKTMASGGRGAVRHLGQFTRSIPGVGPWMDEGRALVQSYREGIPYEDELAYERAIEKQEDLNPSWLNRAEQGAGFATGLALPAAAISKGATAGAAATNAALSGLGYGVAEGAGRGEGINDRLFGALASGGIGAGVGGPLGAAAHKAAPWISEKAGNVYQRLIPKKQEGFDVYHGSPHDFDVFKMENIGTGEGAQTFGHGLYFTDTKEIARNYRDKLSEAIGSKGKIYKANISHDKDKLLDLDKNIRDQPDYIKESIKKIYPEKPKSNPEIREVKDGFQIFVGNEPVGFPYGRRIDAEKRISAGIRLNQTDEVKELTGLNIIGDLEGRFGKEGASSALDEAGIKGLKYLDEWSRGSGEGSRNYVIFDDSLINIVRKYGVGPALAAGLITEDQAAQFNNGFADGGMIGFERSSVIDYPEEKMIGFTPTWVDRTAKSDKLSIIPRSLSERSIPSTNITASGGFESGTSDRTRSLGNYSEDTGGSRSFGAYGLNTLPGNSAWQFRDEFGKGLGITADPNTLEFKKQWDAVAAKNPKALIRAEDEFYARHMTDSAVKGLKRLGLPDEFVNDPRIQAFASDRVNQYGAGLAYGNRHKARWRTAYANSGGKPEKFLENMAELDRAGLGSDFKTYLKKNPGHKKGLSSRITRRLGTSLNVGSVDADVVSAANAERRDVVDLGGPKVTYVGEVGRNPVGPEATNGPPVSSGNVQPLPGTSALPGGRQVIPGNEQRGGLLKRLFGSNFNPLNLSDDERRAMLVSGLTMMSTGDVGKGGLAGIQAMQSQRTSALKNALALAKLRNIQAGNRKFVTLGYDDVGNPRHGLVNMRTGQVTPVKMPGITPSSSAQRPSPSGSPISQNRIPQSPAAARIQPSPAGSPTAVPRPSQTNTAATAAVQPSSMSMPLGEGEYLSQIWKGPVPKGFIQRTLRGRGVYNESGPVFEPKAALEARGRTQEQLAVKRGAARLEKEGSFSGVENIIQNAKKMTDMPGFENALRANNVSLDIGVNAGQYGMVGGDVLAPMKQAFRAWDPENPVHAAADEIKSIQNRLTLILGRAYMKGQGQVSNYERQMVADAIGALGKATSKADFQFKLNSINGMIRDLKRGEKLTDKGAYDVRPDEDELLSVFAVPTLGDADDKVSEIAQKYNLPKQDMWTYVMTWLEHKNPAMAKEFKAIIKRNTVE